MEHLLQSQVLRRQVVHHILAQALWQVEALEDPLRQGQVVLIQAQLPRQAVRHILAQALWWVEALEDPLRQGRVAIVQAQLPWWVVRHILAQALWRVEGLENPLRHGGGVHAVDVNQSGRCNSEFTRTTQLLALNCC
ncbi:hypothetical protein BAE44_0011360 [Dichanthelium oligosanthes]|uniref:Uncharacterized protein n=1 Tax=Dichanthelium oligosanthes TaxID=888268 RepID=A0A1E5VR56_9POAL|nr:hypothetical protein BAE44_0011360 [Dichanthelium oligosanthes]